jgi:hypothetical protein
MGSRNSFTLDIRNPNDTNVGYPTLIPKDIPMYRTPLSRHIKESMCKSLRGFFNAKQKEKYIQSRVQIKVSKDVSKRR